LPLLQRSDYSIIFANPFGYVASNKFPSDAVAVVVVVCARRPGFFQPLADRASISINL